LQLPKLVQNIQSILVDAGFSLTDHKTISYGVQFRLSKGEWDGVLRLYQNKKGETRIDYSQLADQEFAESVIRLLEPKKEHKTVYDIELPLIGADESGKGDYFGPLVCAAVHVDRDSETRLRAMGIRDSKDISDDKIAALAQKVNNACANRTALFELPPAQYNAQYKKFIEGGAKLNTMLAWAHANAIKDVLSKRACSRIVVDQFGHEHLLEKALDGAKKKLHIIQLHRGEKNIAVAAASILARAQFLQSLRELSTTYGMTCPRGASDRVVEAARQFASRHGEEELKQVAKLHFKTTLRVLDLFSSKR
jgi:ribonuclease HIII